MSSKKKTEIENSVGPGNGQQDETKENRKQRLNKKKKTRLIKLEIRNSAEGKEGNVGMAYFATKDQANKTIKTLSRSK